MPTLNISCKIVQKHPISAHCPLELGRGMPVGFDVLTLDEAAERARVSRRQLNYRLAKGDGPALTMIGGARRIRTDLLEE